MTGIKIYHSTCVPPMGKLKYELNSDICMPDSLLSRLCEKIERSLYLKISTASRRSRNCFNWNSS